MSKDNLSDMLLAHKFRQHLCDVASLHLHDLSAQVLCEAEVGVQRALPFRIVIVGTGIDIHYIQFTADTLSHTGFARNQVLGRRVGTDSNPNSLCDVDVAPEGSFLVEIRLQAAIHNLSHVAQRNLTQRDQVAGTEEIAERPIDPLHGIDVTAPHALLQSLGRQVRHHDLVHALQHPVGNRLAHQHPGDLVHHGSNALQVLDVHGRKNIDTGVENLEDILVALGVLASFNVSVGELIDQNDLRFARDDSVYVHLFEKRSLVVNFLARHGLETAGEFGGGFAAMGLNYADHHVFAAALAANCLAQHVIGLTHPGGVTKEQLENATLLFGCGLLQPLLCGFLHVPIHCAAAVTKCRFYTIES